MRSSYDFLPATSRSMHSEPGWTRVDAFMGENTVISEPGWHRVPSEPQEPQGWHTQPPSYFPPPPHVHRETGTLRVRVGGVGDAPADGRRAAYFVRVGLNDQPAASTQPLPQQHSALLRQDAWQSFSYSMVAPAASASVVRLELVELVELWHPSGAPISQTCEVSHGSMAVPCERVLTGGRLELLAPLEVAIEIDWLPPASASVGEADWLVGSGVRRVTVNDAEAAAAREKIWLPGHAPTPSVISSIHGLPPSTPPRRNHKWQWGGTNWHEVPVMA